VAQLGKINCVIVGVTAAGNADVWHYLGIVFKGDLLDWTDKNVYQHFTGADDSHGRRLLKRRA